MDNFFKAHSTMKSKSKSRLKSKNQLKTKLKLMLNGYKQNDKNAIRSAVEENHEESEPDFPIDDTSDADLSIIECQKSPHLVSSTLTAIKNLENSHSSESFQQLYHNGHGEKDLEHCSVVAICDENSYVSATDEEFNSSNSDDNNDSAENTFNESTEGEADSDVSTSNESSLSELSNENSDASETSLKQDVSYFDTPEIVQLSSVDQISDDDVSSIDDDFDNAALESSSTSSNVTISTVEFDKDGDLASTILKKLKKTKKRISEISESFPVEPSCSGYIQNKKKNKSSVQNTIHKQGDNIQVPKMKMKNKNLSYTYDASNMKLPECPLSFRDYNYSTTKNLTVKSVHFSSMDTVFQLCDLKDAEINYCPVDDEDIEDCTDELDESIPPEGNCVLDHTENTENSVLNRTEIENSVLYHTNNMANHIHALENSSMDCEDNDSNELLKEKFLFVENGVLAIMKHPAEMYLHGKANVKSLCGEVDVMGYKLSDKFTKIYAPRFSFAQKLTTRASDCSRYGLFSKLTSLGLPVLKTEEIVVNIKEHDAILYFERLNDISLDFVENEFGSAEIFQMSKKTLSYEQYPDVASKLNCSLYTSRPHKYFEEIPVWPEIVKYNKGKSSRGIVCGGKGTGKTTLMKYLINSAMPARRVLVVDLDPGQSEFTVCGNVSATVVSEPVVGPNFTHLLEPRKMLNVGLINVLENLERYFSAVTEIIEHVQQTEEYTDMPWIVNTMGLSNSIGLKILTYIIALLKPTYLVQMDSKTEGKCFDMLLNSEEIKRLCLEYEEDSMFENLRVPGDINYRYFMSSSMRQTPKENLTAKAKRYLCFLAYFGKLLNRGVNSILSVRPYVIELKSLKIATNCQVEEDAITSVINGKIVAMCETNFRLTGNTFTMTDNPFNCLAFGLIRGVDLDTGHVYITCTEHSEALCRVNLLVYCDGYPELMLSEAGLPTGTRVPYRAPFRPHNKQLLDTPKRRFNPLQLIKIKRSRRC